MPLQLQEADFSDGEAIANICIRAFFDDPFQKSLFPGIPFDEQVAGVFSRWPNNYGDMSARYKIVVDTDSSKVVSYSKWAFVNTDAGAVVKKPTGFPENFKVEPASTPEGLNKSFATNFTERVHEIRDRVLGDRPQLQLELLGTLPSYERQGAASLHLAWATQLADEKGLACWVQASPMSVHLYKKFGFDIQETVVVRLDESCGGGTQTSSCMMREPKK
ncbi:hypothetical protein N431DRAFT_468621 [Stipitochalara longipes BDJ]|nr:hypothetical protein N431DRAFT_468621 [Stipitochalara longipes BDJ]